MIVRRSSRTDRPDPRAAATLPGAPTPAPARGRRRFRAARLLALTAVGVATAAGVATAPASAAAKERATYRTQALPTGSAVASAASAGTTARRATRIDLRSTKRFSLAALRWSSSAPLTGRMRAQQADGTWTAWSDLESGVEGDDGVTEGTDATAAAAARQRTATVGKQGSTEPTWTGPSRRLQVELTSARPKGLRAAFVDVTGTVPRVTAHAARADDGTAGIQPRAAWDPDNQCKPRAAAGIGSVQAVVVHHTVGTNNYTQAQVPAIILGICKFHRNSNGWNDIGYNVLVDKYGGAWEGRAGGLTNAVIGAQAQGFNTVTAGVSMLGDFTSILPSPEQVATVARVAAWKLAVAGVPRAGNVTLTSAGGSLSRFGSGQTATLPRVMGHRDVGETACPGNTGYTILDSVRASVAAANPILPATLPPPVTSAPLPVRITISTRRRVGAGTPLVVAGSARQGTAALKGATVALQVQTGANEFKTLDTARTNTAGKYQFSRKFSRSWTLRVVRTDGDGGTSAAVEMVVVPKLKLTVPSRFRVNKRVVLRGSIAPGRGPVKLTVERRAKNGKYVAGSTLPVTLKGRSLSVAITPHSATLYRFRLIYEGSELAAAAQTPLLFGRATQSTEGGGAGVS